MTYNGHTALSVHMQQSTWLWCADERWIFYTCASVTKQNNFTLWLGRSAVALAMRYKLSGLSTYSLEGLRKGDENEHPTYASANI